MFCSLLDSRTGLSRIQYIELLGYNLQGLVREQHFGGVDMRFIDHTRMQLAYVGKENKFREHFKDNW